jgi:hypothetical protein
LKRFLLQPIKRFLQAILLGFFGLLLGRSTGDEFSIGENDRWKNWTGRIHHLEKNVTDTVGGSEDRVKASVGALETRLATIESSAKASADSLQASVDSLQASAVALETQLVVTLKEILLRLDKMEKK